MNYNIPHQVKQVLKLKLTKMGDLVNIRISSEADKIAVLLKEKYYFSTNTTVYRFAMAYAMKNYKEELMSNYEHLDIVYPSDGTNLNVGTVDTSEHMLKQLVQIIAPNCITPYRFIRVAIIMGLYKIKEMIDSGEHIDVVQHILS